MSTRMGTRPRRDHGIWIFTEPTYPAAMATGSPSSSSASRFISAFFSSMSPAGARKSY